MKTAIKIPRCLFYAITVNALFAMGGCVSYEKQPATSAHSIAETHTAEQMLVKSKSLSRTFETRLGLAVAAADISARAFAKNGRDSDRLLYNRACTAVAVLSQQVTLPITLSTPVGSYYLETASPPSEKCWKFGYFNTLIPTEKIKNQRFVAKPPLSGFGGVLVGVHRESNLRAHFYPKIGVSAPVTAVLNTESPTKSGAPTRASLLLYDPSRQSTARIAGATGALAADLSAPFGYYPAPSTLGIVGAFRPYSDLFKQKGLFLTQPYDPNKIPVVFIHGLMSYPQLWLPLITKLEADPELRQKYQFWTFAYPTGNPLLYSAIDLREALAKVYKVYPKTPNMVIVNHSMGGILSHLQVINPGDTLAKEIFKEKASEILASSKSKLLKKALFYSPTPYIDRIVFVAAPHRGAPMAKNWIGNLGASLIRLPGTMIHDVGQHALQAIATSSGNKADFIPNGINGLSPTNPVFKAMNTLPIKVPFHSIIGVVDKPEAPLEKTSDSVVPYWSAHLPGAISEKIVPFPHAGMVEKPDAMEEIKRILRLHLAKKTTKTVDR